MSEREPGPKPERELGQKLMKKPMPVQGWLPHHVSHLLRDWVAMVSLCCARPYRHHPMESH
jgi:hypothetical protein